MRQPPPDHERARHALRALPPRVATKAAQPARTPSRRHHTACAWVHTRRQRPATSSAPSARPRLRASTREAARSSCRFGNATARETVHSGATPAHDECGLTRWTGCHSAAPAGSTSRNRWGRGPRPSYRVSHRACEAPRARSHRRGEMALNRSTRPPTSSPGPSRIARHCPMSAADTASWPRPPWRSSRKNPSSPWHECRGTPCVPLGQSERAQITRSRPCVPTC